MELGIINFTSPSVAGDFFASIIYWLVGIVGVVGGIVLMRVRPILGLKNVDSKVNNILKEAEMFLISAAFYVFDLVCVVIWCPFRLLMKTRCCTTCRIFNWDHLMMFTPMLFIKGFFSISLIAVAASVFILWELSILLHPERFWERSNCSIRCSGCSDYLCPTNYSKKIKVRLKK
jgi:hypothetical protein